MLKIELPVFMIKTGHETFLRLSIICAFSLLFIISTGCDVTGTNQVTDGPSYGGKAVIGNYSKPGPINPLLTSSTMSVNLYSLLFNGLTRLDEDRIFPDLAATWEVSADELIYTFYLRAGAKFHDGLPVTAEDVKYTYETGRTLGLPSLNRIERVDAVNDHTVRVVLNRPTPRFLDFSATTVILPKHKLKDGALDSTPFNNHPIGTGPFKYAGLIDSTQIVFTAHHDYYAGRPYLDSVIVRTDLNSRSLLSRLMRQEIDVSPSLSPEDMRWVKLDSTTFTVHTHLAPFYYMILFNNDHPIFSDRRVRNAISLSIDKRKIIDLALYGYGSIASGPFLPDSWANNPDVLPVPYNPKKALEILHAAGWKDRNKDGRLDKDGRPFNVSVLIDAGDKSKAQSTLVIRQALQEVGVEVTFDQVPTPIFHERLRIGDYELALGQYNTGPDPELAGYFWDSNYIGQFNCTRYKNTNIDSLFRVGKKSISRSERTTIYREIHKQLAIDNPATFLYFKHSFSAVNRRLSGVKSLREYNLFHFIHQWYIQ